MTNAEQTAAAVAIAMRARDTAIRDLNIDIAEVRPGRARAAMRVTASMLNGHAVCHGGYVFTLADTAFAYACNSYDRLTLAAAASIEFLLASRLHDELTAQAEERSRSKRQGIYDVVVTNQRHETVALFRGRSHELGDRITAGPT
jgi:acyl-CoA thioesterase